MCGFKSFRHNFCKEIVDNTICNQCILSNDMQSLSKISTFCLYSCSILNTIWNNKKLLSHLLRFLHTIINQLTLWTHFIDFEWWTGDIIYDQNN